MATNQISGFIQRLRGVLRDGAGLTDGQLLGDYLSRRDEAAVAALVRRHGPMVWGVCRRVLCNHHDAEDAFQTTFLVLVRKAASIASRELLANWLYGVAHQTALKARATAAKRKGRERQMTETPEPAATEQELWRDLQPLLDEELSRLPDKYRGVIVLCDLEGKTRKEVAGQLRCPEGTVAGRLARARIILAKRLTRRGVALSGGAVAAVLSQQAASAGVPASVAASTIKAASLFAAGKAAATGAISVKVAALTDGVMKAMLFTKLKAVVAVMLILGFAAAATTVLTGRTAAGREDKKPAAEQPVARETNDKPETLKDEEAIQGTWQAVALEDEGEKDTAKAVTAAKIRLAFTGNKVVMSGLNPFLLEASNPALTFVLNEKTTPKQIDIIADGWTEIGIYAFEKGQLKICLDRTGKNRPTSFTTKKGTDQYCMTLQKQENEKEGFTAWGKEIGGLQAGLGYKPGQNLAYTHGETVTLVLRLRNVGKETAKFSYLQPFIEQSLTVTDNDGKLVPQPNIIPDIGERDPGVVEVPPGKEIELYELKRQLRPASESSSTKEKRPFPLYAAGKVSVQYDHVLGPPEMGLPGWKLDPALRKLASGTLELEVKADGPAKPGVKAPEKQAEQDNDAKLKPLKLRVYIEKVNAETQTITASCMLLGEIDNVTKPLKFENLRVSENAMLREGGKEIQFKLTDLKLDAGYFLYLKVYEDGLGFEVVGIEKIGVGK